MQPASRACTVVPPSPISTSTSHLRRRLVRSLLPVARDHHRYRFSAFPCRTLRWIPPPSPRKKRRGREDRTSRCKAWGERSPAASSRKNRRAQESRKRRAREYAGEEGRSEIEDLRSCVLAFSVSVSLRCFPTSIGFTYPPTQRATVARILRYGKKDGGGLLHKASISRGGGFSWPGYARRYGSVKGETQERGAEVGKHPQRRTPVVDTDDEDRRRRERVGSVPGGDGARNQDRATSLKVSAALRREERRREQGEWGLELSQYSISVSTEKWRKEEIGVHAAVVQVDDAAVTRQSRHSGNPIAGALSFQPPPPNSQTREVVGVYGHTMPSVSRAKDWRSKQKKKRALKFNRFRVPDVVASSHSRYYSANPSFFPIV
ncbi:hypothetical protein R3P38DRAFT_2815011 [Favolaschia claudopus]|uniref:Uncharacterized protein n=1 Tax=Favolaschia claudopus TaxID=2862362 RepID=A0AAV9Z2B3_9AGAR